MPWPACLQPVIRRVNFDELPIANWDRCQLLFDYETERDPTRLVAMPDMLLLQATHATHATHSCKAYQAIAPVHVTLWWNPSPGNNQAREEGGRAAGREANAPQ